MTRKELHRINVDSHRQNDMKESQSQINAKQTNAPLKVGHYGCNDSLVRVGYHGPPKKKAPHSAVVDCPACNSRHGVANFMWRPAKSFTEWETAEVHLTVEPDDAGD